jgi:hypothetical protein
MHRSAKKLATVRTAIACAELRTEAIDWIARKERLLDFEFDDDANSQSFMCLYTSKQSEVDEEAVLG